jgi:hypothetical protein
MGYTTTFTGKFALSATLTSEQKNYIQLFSKTRRVKRDVTKLQEMFNGEFGFNGSYGNDGEYFVKDDGCWGQNYDDSVIDGNCPPGQLDRKMFETFDEWWAANNKHIVELKCVPELWCNWTVDNSGNFLKWNNVEKFYNYIPWLNYLILHFFEPWGINLNGKVKWQGEDSSDKGTIKIIDNKVMWRIRE